MKVPSFVPGWFSLGLCLLILATPLRADDSKKRRDDRRPQAERKDNDRKHDDDRRRDDHRRDDHHHDARLEELRKRQAAHVREVQELRTEIERLRAAQRLAETRRAHNDVRSAVNEELHETAAAIRRLDQSYAIRGYRSAHAWTAGSAYLDRNRRATFSGGAVGVPAPIVLGHARPDDAIGRWYSRAVAGAVLPVPGMIGCQTNLTAVPVFSWYAIDRAVIRTGVASVRVPGWCVRGAATIDARGWMNVTGGAFYARSPARPLMPLFRRSGEFTLLAIVQPGSLDQSGPARILTYSQSASSRNFTVGQEGNRVILRLRTPDTGLNGTDPEITLCTLDDLDPIALQIVYRPGKLTAYVDGKLVCETDRITGSFANWEPQYLLVGDEWNGERNWNGDLGGFALYDRAIDPVLDEKVGSIESVDPDGAVVHPPAHSGAFAAPDNLVPRMPGKDSEPVAPAKR